LITEGRKVKEIPSTRNKTKQKTRQEREKERGVHEVLEN
jgi:hypothetical protein